VKTTVNPRNPTFIVKSLVHPNKNPTLKKPVFSMGLPFGTKVSRNFSKFFISQKSCNINALQINTLLDVIFESLFSHRMFSLSELYFSHKVRETKPHKNKNKGSDLNRFKANSQKGIRK